MKCCPLEGHITKCGMLRHRDYAATVRVKQTSTRDENHPVKPEGIVRESFK